MHNSYKNKYMQYQGRPLSSPLAARVAGELNCTPDTCISAPGCADARSFLHLVNDCGVDPAFAQLPQVHSLHLKLHGTTSSTSFAVRQQICTAVEIATEQLRRLCHVPECSPIDTIEFGLRHGSSQELPETQCGTYQGHSACHNLPASK
jgi:hypothetical protein